MITHKLAGEGVNWDALQICELRFRESRQDGFKGARLLNAGHFDRCAHKADQSPHHRRRS